MFGSGYSNIEPMNSFIPMIKKAGISLVILIALIVLFSSLGFLNINMSHVGENAFFFVLWWGLISIPVFAWPILVANRMTVLRMGILVVFFVIILIVDDAIRIPDNPLTIALVTVFWLGVVYLALPKFFLKYSKYILTAYALILSYFIYVRLFTPSFEIYVSEKKETALLLFFLPIPVLIAVWIYEQWRWIRSLQTEKTNAELALLRTQINPHFFFNTLNNLYSLTIKHSDQAPEVILKLSDMMRYTIYEGEKPLVPVKEEITYLQNYIDLHKIRYKKKVDISFEQQVDDGIKVAPLLFIILLENAFKHGVESISEAAFVHISLRSEGDQIHFSIRNNYDPDEVQSTKGIGLDNLRRRLNLLYPKQHSLNFTSEGNIFNVELTLESR